MNERTPPKPTGKPARGILRQPPGAELQRVLPGSELAPLIEHHWWVRWSMREPQITETLAHPTIHIVFERQGHAPVEEAAVEMPNLGQVEVSALRHRGEQAVEIFLALIRALEGAPQHAREKSLGQEAHILGEEAEDELVDEVRDRLAVGDAAL